MGLRTAIDALVVQASSALRIAGAAGARSSILARLDTGRISAVAMPYDKVEWVGREQLTRQSTFCSTISAAPNNAVDIL